jgi:hypothetical protein
MLESYFDDNGAKHGGIALSLNKANDGSPHSGLFLYKKKEPLSFPTIAPNLDGESDAV